MADPGCGTGSTGDFARVCALLWLVWPCPHPRGESGQPGPGKRSSCAGDARNKVPLPVRQPVICIQMRRKSSQPRPEGEGDLGCGKRGEAAQCVPPELLAQPPAQRAWAVGCSPSAILSCLSVCLFFLPFLTLLLFLLFPPSSACMPLLLFYAENLG